ncbi:MAG: protein kinase [Kofleriaceae bacterium]
MDRLGRYQILDPIGSGPCGAVVRAKVYGVVGVDRQFAIKQILPSLTANPAYAQALSAAARAYGSLEHPRIARLAEYTVSQGKTFTATELVTGLDVGRLVAESRVSGAPLPPGGALALLSAAARAVGHAHGRGLTHLGLCPQNLLISSEGDIKVTDFGILAACLPPTPVDEPRLAHRVAYLAPEQLLGEAVTASTDVFALGAIAIEMVTTTPAFRGETPRDVQEAVLSGHISDPSLPRPIVRVLQRCLARAPFERFPDARALADALDAALRAAPVVGTRQEISERVKGILAHLAALNEGGLSGVVSLPSAVPPPVTRPPVTRPPMTRPPTVLAPEVIATPTSLRDHDRMETGEYLRDDAYDIEEPGAEDAEWSDPLPPPPPPLRPQRGTDAPMVAATLRGIAAASPPRPMPPPVPSAGGASGPPSRPLPAVPRQPTSGVTATASPAPPAANGRGGVEPIAEDTTARHRALGSAWDEAMESFEQPTRLNESVTASLLPSTTRTGPAPLLDLDELLAPPPRVATHVLPPNYAAGSVATPPHPHPAAGAELGDPSAAELEGTPWGPPSDPGSPNLSRLEVPPAPSSSSPGLSPHETPTAPSSSSPGLSPHETPTAPSSSSPGLSPHETPTAPSSSSPGLSPHETPTTPRPGGSDSQELDAPRSVSTAFPASVRESIAAPTGTPLGGAPGPHLSISGEPPILAPTRFPPPSAFPPPVPPSFSPLQMPYAEGPVPKITGAASQWVWWILGVALAGGAAAVAWAVFFGANQRGTLALESVDAPTVAVALDDAPAVDAGVDATLAATVSPDAAVDDHEESAEGLTILSNPPGAQVYVDGADQGRTPVHLSGPPDRHSAVVFLPGHDLGTLELDKNGTFTAELKEITPLGGPGGIKVRCRIKERYYVYIDGKPTGALCPTERLEVDRGEHLLEIYDLVTETRRQFRVVVKEVSRSTRVRVD